MSASTKTGDVFQLAPKQDLESTTRAPTVINSKENSMVESASSKCFSDVISSQS